MSANVSHAVRIADSVLAQQLLEKQGVGFADLIAKIRGGAGAAAHGAQGLVGGVKNVASGIGGYGRGVASDVTNAIKAMQQDYAGARIGQTAGQAASAVAGRGVPPLLQQAGNRASELHDVMRQNPGATAALGGLGLGGLGLGGYGLAHMGGSAGGGSPAPVSPTSLKTPAPKPPAASGGLGQDLLAAAAAGAAGAGAGVGAGGLAAAGTQLAGAGRGPGAEQQAPSQPPTPTPDGGGSWMDMLKNYGGQALDFAKNHPLATGVGVPLGLYGLYNLLNGDDDEEKNASFGTRLGRKAAAIGATYSMPPTKPLPAAGKPPAKAAPAKPVAPAANRPTMPARSR